MWHPYTLKLKISRARARETIHQTTTFKFPSLQLAKLYMSLFLHQTTTNHDKFLFSAGCICLYSYIKPQHLLFSSSIYNVVYVSIPTSNRNTTGNSKSKNSLYMSLFLHQTTTLFAFLFEHELLYMSLFLHQTTTLKSWNIFTMKLYMSLFLHQTTTNISNERYHSLLYMSLFLHQTTTRGLY